MVRHWNCLSYAIGRWWDEGGYVVFVRSTNLVWGFHTLYSPDLVTFREYVPKRPRRRILPPLRFDGYVKEWQPRRRDEPRAVDRRMSEPVF